MHYFVCFPFAALLEVGINQIIHRVQLFSDVTLVVRGKSRSQIGSDGIIPHAEACEDVRRHMQGMRGGGRNFRVGTRCSEALLSHFLVVAGMDQIMRDSGVPWVFVKMRLENLRGKLLSLMRLVEGRSASQEREGIKDLRFWVLRICCRELSHSAFVVGYSLSIRDGAEIS